MGQVNSKGGDREEFGGENRGGESGRKHEEGGDSRNRIQRRGEEGKKWKEKLFSKNLNFVIFFFLGMQIPPIRLQDFPCYSLSCSFRCRFLVLKILAL